LLVFKAVRASYDGANERAMISDSEGMACQPVAEVLMRQNVAAVYEGVNKSGPDGR
jgi:hypothetical protein